MEKREEAEILSLVDQVPELRSLYTEHQDLKKKLDKLNHKHYLTPDEELERKRILSRVPGVASTADISAP